MTTIIIGILAMESKARSKPMRNILTRVLALGNFEAVVFGDQVILHEDIENWPTCHVLISFFSIGFPLQKAMDYVKLRDPYCVNSVFFQELLLDRRFVLKILDSIGVPTPKRLVSQRGDLPIVSLDNIAKVQTHLQIDVSPSTFKFDIVTQIDKDTISDGTTTLKKPFVEKPVSGEDHNINIYYSDEMGGGGRRLFRKIGDKSSEYSPSLSTIRTDQSYIYEEFMRVDNAEDVKVYTIGSDYAHAETRKSPVVDGVVRRNADGKEIRYITELSDFEKDIARKVTHAFGQNVCGFDLLRANGSSYVIDVNGWSFVKGNNDYYDKCASILKVIFTKEVNYRKPGMLARIFKQPPPIKTIEKPWKLKAFVSVLRHADRTPKQKLKFNFKSQTFINLLNGGLEEVVLKKTEDLELVIQTVKQAKLEKLENDESLNQLLIIMELKIVLLGTKVQIKPSLKKTSSPDENKSVSKVQLIVKWGGEVTHGGLHHSKDLGENLRKDLLILNKNILNDLKVYSSSEQRVTATAEVFSKALLEVESLPSGFLNINKEMLDDSNAAKDQMDAVKKNLQLILSPLSGTLTESQLTSPCSDVDLARDFSTNHFAKMTEVALISYQVKKPPSDSTFMDKESTSFMLADPKVQLTLDNQPVAVMVEDMIDIMNNLRASMRKNFETLDTENIQDLWCCSESPVLFRERWEKIFKDFCDVQRGAFEPSKVSELSDTLKYDLLHNRKFIDTVFESENGFLKQLYIKSRSLFQYIGPKEYGIEDKEKYEISVLSSSFLIKQIVSDLNNAVESDQPCTKLFFTKESKVICLLNYVLLCGLKTKFSVWAGNPNRGDLQSLAGLNYSSSNGGLNCELDYLTQITFELYERNGESVNSASSASISGSRSSVLRSERDYSFRIGFSPGAYDHNLIDLQLDEEHSLGVAPRKFITDHINFSEALLMLGKL